ncbi:g1967 [Coccomyxa elongata]
MSTKDDQKPILTVQAEASSRSASSSTGLNPQTHLHHLSFWQRLGQSINLVGIGLFLRVLFGKHQWALPHVSVPSIAWLDWEALRRAGFEGCVFDKDNTLTEPYANEVAAQLLPSLRRCQQAFNGRLVLFSNSAGLAQFDPQGKQADALEVALGIPVLRHREKKPAGAAADLEAHFGCSSSKLIMIGDRYLTDVVYGNRHGMLTIRPTPLTTAGEPFAVRMARDVENFFVKRWRGQGNTAPTHPMARKPEALYSFVADNKIALW